MDILKRSCAFFFLLCVIGCGSSKPSVEDGRNGIINFWAPCNQFIKVVEFEKTNGIDQGEKRYTMTYSYTIELIRDFNVALYNKAEMCSDPIVHSLFLATMRTNLPKEQLGKNDYVARKGMLVKLQGEGEFTKTENGWRMSK